MNEREVKQYVPVFRSILAKAQYTAAQLRALAAKLEAQRGQA